MLDAYVFCRVLVCVVRLLVAPREPRLRLVHISDEGARFAVRFTWVVGASRRRQRRGPGRADARHVSLGPAGVVQARGARRRADADRRRASLPPGGRIPLARATRGRDGRGWRHLRNRFAERWHLVAIFYLVAVWLVWAVEVEDGIARLVQFALSTSAVLVVARLVGILVLGGWRSCSGSARRRWATIPGWKRGRASTTRIRRLAVGVTAGLTVVALLEVWGFAPVEWLAGSSLGGQVLSAVALITVTVVLAVLAWEAANVAIARHLSRLSQEEQSARAGRLRTLLPFLRTTLLVSILVVVSLTVLSQIGVNIAPLLAGAGVVGIAVGFGSQTLVKDVITGLFLLLENAMQVGDTVTVAGLTGIVETLSIRTIRLRAGDGSMHIIPFSAVTTVNNTSRDFAYAAVSVGVAYTEDTDRVSKVLEEIVAGMRADPLFERDPGDFSLWGVDQLGDFAVTIKGQVKTTAAGRWSVQREINRRILRRFEALGIEIPFPVQTVLLGEAAPPGVRRSPGTLPRRRRPHQPRVTPAPSPGPHGMTESRSRPRSRATASPTCRPRGCGRCWRRRGCRTGRASPRPGTTSASTPTWPTAAATGSAGTPPSASRRAIERKPNQPHYQSRDYNALNGGIARWFDPVTDEVAASPALRAILATCYALFDPLSPRLPGTSSCTSSASRPAPARKAARRRKECTRTGWIGCWSCSSRARTWPRARRASPAQTGRRSAASPSPSRWTPPS